MFKVGAQSIIVPTTRYGKDPQRPSKYPVNDGIDYTGIDFPTPIKQIEKLEAQNENLLRNVFGWENNCVINHRISRKERKVRRINLMLTESGEIQHYCYVKQVAYLHQNVDKGSTLGLSPRQRPQHRPLLRPKPQSLLLQNNEKKKKQNLSAQKEKEKKEAISTN